MLLMPESPFYLVTKGRETEARRALQWLRGRHYDIEDEYAEMVATHQRQQEIGTISIQEFCTKRVYLLPGLIMIALMFFQQYSGINAVLMYLTDIFNKADTGMSSGLSATLVTLVQVSIAQMTGRVCDNFDYFVGRFWQPAWLCSWWRSSVESCC